MTVTTLTATERQAKLETLASIDIELLATTTVKELREMVKGVVTNYSKLPKTDLLELITDLTAKYRQDALEAKQIALVTAKEAQERLAELEAANLSQATPEGHRTATGLASHKDIIEEVKTELEKVATLSVQKQETALSFTTKVGSIATNYLLLLNSCYKETTRKSNVTDMNNALDSWVSSLGSDVFKDDKKNAVDVFKSGVKYSMNNLNKAISNDYLMAVKTRTDNVEDLVKVEAKPVIERAIEVLTALADYRDVAIALAIVTGRRMSEIMATLRVHGTEDGMLLVSGLNKAKSDKETAGNKVYSIPVLADPSLIVAALEYLQEYREETAETVNDKYAKTMSRQMGKWVDVIGTKANFKSLRALYAEVCYKRFGYADGRRKVNYLAEILGHSEKDLTTAGSYEVWNVID